MKSKMSLKKEIANIIDNAEFLGNKIVNCNIYEGKKHIPQTNMYVTEVVNEHGYKCVYYFKENSKDILLQRAASASERKATSYKFKDRENGNNTQKVVLYLKEHKETLQVLCDIRYLMKAHKCGAQEACKVLFKDKKQLPHNFYVDTANGFNRSTIYYFYGGVHFPCIKIEYLIDYMLPILPKSYFEGIERLADINE